MLLFNDLCLNPPAVSAKLSWSKLSARPLLKFEESSIVLLWAPPCSMMQKYAKYVICINMQVSNCSDQATSWEVVVNTRACGFRCASIGWSSHLVALICQITSNNYTPNHPKWNFRNAPGACTGGGSGVGTLGVLATRFFCDFCGWSGCSLDFLRTGSKALVGHCGLTPFRLSGERSGSPVFKIFELLLSSNSITALHGRRQWREDKVRETQTIFFSRS